MAPQLRHTSPRAGLGGDGSAGVESAGRSSGAVRVMRRLPPHLPRAGPSSRAGRNWHLRCSVRAVVAGASSGRVPLPLWMSGTPRLYPVRRAVAPQSGCARGRAASSTPTSTARWSARAGRSGTPPDGELTDGTRRRRCSSCTGPASRWCWSAGAPTRRSWRPAGSSPRTAPSPSWARWSSWDGGRETHLLTGELPAEFAGRTPMEVMADLGVVEALLGGTAGPAGVARALARHARPPTPCSAAGSTRSPSTPGWPSAAGLADPQGQRRDAPRRRG